MHWSRLADLGPAAIIAALTPWSGAPRLLSLATAGRQGEDRLRLRFSIDTDGMLVVEGEDLEMEGSAGLFGPFRLGPVR